MIVGDVISVLKNISPFDLAEDWDNVGLLIGNAHNRVSEIITTLDCLDEVVDFANDSALIISHHPIFFKPFKRLDFQNPSIALVEKIIKKNISVVAMHTNFDKTHLNSAFAKILGLSGICEGFLFKADYAGEFEALVLQIKYKLFMEFINVVPSGKKQVSNVVIVCGSGGDFIDKIDCDVLITGDIKYHQAIIAKQRGVALIDVTHYLSEGHFAPLMQKLLAEKNISSIVINSLNPFKAIS